MSERDLWQAKQEGCEAARMALIARYGTLVPTTRAKAIPRAPSRFHDDLLAAGRLALVKAVDRYDPERGVQFSSYAINLIRCEMIEWLRQEDWAPRSVRDGLRAGLPVHVWEMLSLEAISYHEEGAEPLSVLGRLSDWEDTPDRIVPDRIEAGVLGLLVRCLPKRERRLMMAYYWEDVTYSQIAERLDLSESRVHQIHGEALSLLKTWLVQREAGCAR